MQDSNLPPGVTQQMIDNHYGYDDSELDFYVDNVNVYDDELEVEVTWTKDGDSYVWYNQEECESVSELYDKNTCFYIPLECKGMNEEELKDYIDINCNPY